MFPERSSFYKPWRKYGTGTVLYMYWAVALPRVGAPQVTAQKVGRSVGRSVGGGATDRPSTRPIYIGYKSSKFTIYVHARAHLTTYMRVMFLHPTS